MSVTKFKQALGSTSPTIREAPNPRAFSILRREWRMSKTAILVDGGFYQKRAQYLWGKRTPVERANELITYCMRHLEEKHEKHRLYRIFYYDCPPIDSSKWHPFLHTNINFKKTDQYMWMTDFLEELRKKRKVALRLGILADKQSSFILNDTALKELCNGTRKWEDISESDFVLNLEQKGVDMKIGVDIASLAFKKQVEQIVLISGDSDFVPAAKLARREGIDFILDPLHTSIKPELFEHIDGLCSHIKKPNSANKDK